MPHIDLSHDVTAGMETYPGLPVPVVADHLPVGVTIFDCDGTLVDSERLGNEELVALHDWNAATLRILGPELAGRQLTRAEFLAELKRYKRLLKHVMRYKTVFFLGLFFMVILAATEPLLPALTEPLPVP